VGKQKTFREKNVEIRETVKMLTGFHHRVKAGGGDRKRSLEPSKRNKVAQKEGQTRNWGRVSTEEQMQYQRRGKKMHKPKVFIGNRKRDEERRTASPTKVKNTVGP